MYKYILYYKYTFFQIIILILNSLANSKFRYVEFFFLAPYDFKIPRFHCIIFIFCMQLSLPIFFTRHPQHDRGDTALKMSVKLKQQGEDITYLEFCKLFVDIYQDQSVLNICKEIYSSQVNII